MKPTAFLLIFLAALSGGAWAQERSAADALDPQHRLLESVAGRWSVRQSFWSAPGQAPKIDSGKASFDMVLNRRHLRQTLHIDDGAGFEGLSYFGYDNASGQFFSTWMDVNFPGLVIAYGRQDAAANRLVLRGAMAPSREGAEAVPVREVLTILDADHARYEFYEMREGKEFLAVRLEYTRLD